MGCPQKIPLNYAELVLQHYLDDPNASLESGTVANSELLVSTQYIKSKFFKRKKAEWEKFRNDYLCDIDPDHWEQVIDDEPTSAKYCKRFIPNPKAPHKKRARSRSPSPARSQSLTKRAPRSSPAKKKHLKYNRTFSQQDLNNLAANESAFVLQPEDADDKDLNMPASVCRGIRRACRNYGPDKRYRNFEDDQTDDHEYVFYVKY